MIYRTKYDQRCRISAKRRTSLALASGEMHEAGFELLLATGKADVYAKLQHLRWLSSTLILVLSLGCLR